MTEARHAITVIVNGHRHLMQVVARETLADLLREQIGLSSVRVGCGRGHCGTCSLILDGNLVRGCLVLAVQADGAQVESLEGLPVHSIGPVRDAFCREKALQCGFCTPGFIVSICFMLRQDFGRAAALEGLANNLCRCTGYAPIAAVIDELFSDRRDPAASPTADMDQA